MAVFKTGVLGCGRISVVYREALAALQKTGRLQVCIAVDKDIARAQEFASRFPGCAAGARLEDLLAAKPDAVHILTPHFLHKEQTVACLEAGIHVLCEKPIAIHLADADAMIAAAQSSGRQLGVIYQNRYIKGVQHARQLLQSGALGPVRGAWSALNWWRPPSYYECDWKGSWEKEGGGVVIDQAIHSIDLVRYLLGCEAVSVKGSIDRRVLTNIEVEDVADAAITFENGAVYAFSACNYNTRNAPIQIEVSAEKGVVHLCEATVTVTPESGEAYTVAPEGGGAHGGQSYWGRDHARQIDDFYTCLAAGRPVPFAPQDAKKTLELVQGIYASAHSGRACAIPAGLPPYGMKYL